MKRNAFTLVELLVAVTIIAILSLIGLQVVGGALNLARESATKTTIEKIQRMLNSRAQALDRQLARKGYLGGSMELAFVRKSLPSAPNGTQTVIARKLAAARFFPQHAGEIYDLTLYPQSSGVQNGSPADVLHWFLTQNVLGNSPEGTDAFTSAEERDTNGNGLPEFVDAWGSPLRFYRWPTRLIRSGGQTGPNALALITADDIARVKSFFPSIGTISGDISRDLARDADDPLQDCLTSIPNFESATVMNTGVRFGTPATWNVFLIVSAGPDRRLGIFEPDDVSNFGHLAAPIPGAEADTADNIWSFGRSR
jgi:prepilin-type N-terminal cleavage/methylation domain-containing protein